MSRENIDRDVEGDEEDPPPVSRQESREQAAIHAWESCQ